MNILHLFALAASLTLSSLSAPSAAADDILAYARDAATMAGGARFCKVDDELVEEFIAKADGQIAFRAKDDYEKVLARLEFKNLLAAAAAREPSTGCDKFIPYFENSVKTAR